MKRFSLLLLLIRLAPVLHGECTSSDLSVFPEGNSLRQNGIIVIEGYSMSEKIVSNLNVQYPVYLKNGEQRIGLKVQEILTGQFRLTQAVLKPEGALVPGVTYALVIDSLPSWETFEKYDPVTLTRSGYTFVVATGADLTAPVIDRNPKEVRKSYVEFGCGPQRWVVYDCPVTDSSEFLVRTTVKDLKTGVTCTYLLTPRSKEIIVGHDMCAGAFYFKEESEKYTVTFAFMDASGNSTKPATEIQFTKPVPADGEGY